VAYRSGSGVLARIEGMIEAFIASELLTGGVGLGFAMSAMMLAIQSRQRAYVWLALLSFLQAGWCIASYGYLYEARPVLALAWARAICIVAPFILAAFAALVVELVGGGVRPRWYRAYWLTNLGLTTVFCVLVVLDGLLGTEIVLGHHLNVDFASMHRHRLNFTPLAQAWLAWVTMNCVAFAIVLFAGYRRRRQLLPIVIGSVVYFAATISDFAVATGHYDMYYVQHLGFLALVAGFWTVLIRRYEHSLRELSTVVGTLHEQRRRLYFSPELAHRNRLDGVGRLAVGVAHEINNPIHGIMSYAELLKRQASDPEALAFASEIAHECARVAGIVNALFSFSRRDDKQRGSLSARDAIEDVARLLRSSRSVEGIQLEVAVADDCPDVPGGQWLKQVLTNLLTNAIDALAERDPARADPKVVRITAFPRRVHDGVWVAIEVIDNGNGIEPAILGRIFDPFFTTKAPGRGTGLGLAISEEIVASSGGQLTCRSVLGEGTVFRVEVPVTGAPYASLPPR
jgi:signal transduction histidine kinase